MLSRSATGARQSLALCAVRVLVSNIPGIGSGQFRRRDVMHLKDVGEVDVVVVGAGNAAMCAAYATQDGGARVVVLEAAPEAECGGNSAFTGGATRFAFSNVEELAEVLTLSE